MRFPLGCREQLTNARRENTHGHGVMLLQTLIDEYAAPELTTSHPLLLITLNGWQEFPDGEVIAGGRVRCFAGWKPEWLVSSVRRKAYDEIGECVSAWWRVDPGVVDHGGIEHATAVHRGVTRALFRIEPGSWETEVFGLRQERSRDQKGGLLVSDHRVGAAVRQGHRPAWSPGSAPRAGSTELHQLLATPPIQHLAAPQPAPRSQTRTVVQVWYREND